MPKLISINPSNYKAIDEIEMSSFREVTDKVRLARSASKEWAGLGLQARISALRDVVAKFEARKEAHVLLESYEMGMPINEARADYDGLLTFANWYLDNAEKYLAPETTFENDSEINRVYREPLGVAAVILPWNYPFLLFVWDVFPSLIAGNTVVMKHSEETPICGKAIEDIMSRCLPKGVFNEVYGDGKVGEWLIKQDIDLLVFTGSTRTGKRLYRKVSQRSNKIVRPVMEMGGVGSGFGV